MQLVLLSLSVVQIPYKPVLFTTILSNFTILKEISWSIHEFLVFLRSLLMQRSSSG